MRPCSRFLLALVLTATAIGCASAPPGASWALADFDKYDRHYAPLQTDSIIIGQSKAELLKALAVKGRTIEAGEGYEILAFQRWKAVAGEDYVLQTLYVRLAGGRVTKWKLTSDSEAIVPPAW